MLKNAENSQSKSLHNDFSDMNMLLWHNNFVNIGYHIHGFHLEVAFPTQIYQNMGRDYEIEFLPWLPGCEFLCNIQLDSFMAWVHV